MESLFKYPMKLVVLVAWLSIVLDPCKFSDICETCHKDASCENVNGSKECHCHSGYTGNGISVCADDDECQNITEICGSNAICTNTIGDYFCTCEHGFKSTGNETFKPNDDTHCVENLKKDCHLNDTCMLKSINETLEHISNITEPLSILEEIQKQTSGHLSPVDVIKYVEALFLSLPSLSVVGVNATNSTITELLKAANNLVEKDEMVTWEKMGKETRKITITKLLHTVEDAALSISKNSKTATILEGNRSDIALKLYAFDAQTTNKINLQATMQGDSIKLTSKTKHTDVNGSISIVFLRYNSISNLLISEASDPTVNSQIVAVALNPKNIYQLDHIEFTLKHSKPVDLEVNGTECAFWNYSVADMRGHWAKEGCGRIYVNRSHTKCRCNHLTHFAILMSSGRADLSDNFNILTRITQLGMIISIICLSMCIFTFWFFSEIQSTRTTIHKNLCCSLFMAEFIYLVGINLYNHKLFCSIIAMLLHYFFLAAFAWMCIEGIHLYLIVVGVIYNKGFLHRNFYIFGYGSPAAVVLISATLGYKYYGTNKACWLSTENNFIWSFIGPACLIILVNLLAFVVIIYKVYHHTAVKKPEISHYENIRSCARGAIALLFVLGATWAFGVLHILNETTVTAYLFTISNAFQGMFIFIFLCVLSRKIQEEYYRLFKNVPCCFECLR